MSVTVKSFRLKNMRLQITELILEALGRIGLAFLLLMVFVLIGTIVIAMVSRWEFALVFLLMGFGAALCLGYVVAIISEFLRTSPPKFIKCPYCGTENPGNANFCLHCEKPLQTYKRRLPRTKWPEKI